MSHKRNTKIKTSNKKINKGKILEKMVTTSNFNTIPLDKIKYINCPQKIKKDTKKKKLKVLKMFMSDKSCPYGADKICFVLEHNYICIKVNNGFNWLKFNPNKL